MQKERPSAQEMCQSRARPGSTGMAYWSAAHIAPPGRLTDGLAGGTDEA